MSAAPVEKPRGASKVPSSRLGKSMPMVRIMRASSRVVRTASTLGLPPFCISGRWHSYFFAVQGMTETTNISLGSTPILSA